MKSNKQDTGRYYIKYSGIAFQMILVVIGFTYLGIWVDGQILWKVKLFTIIGIMSGLGLSMYVLLKNIK
jgi:hypothetical protein